MALLWEGALFLDGHAQAQSATTRSCAPAIEGRVSNAIAARNYDEALAAIDLLGRDAIERFGEHSRCYGIALSERAALLQFLDHNVESQPLFDKAISVLRQTSDPLDPKFSLALSNYGVTLAALRRYKEAARLHEEALDYRRKLVPPDPNAVADSLHNLADAYRYLSPRDAGIEKLYNEALEIKQGLSQPNNVSIAQTRQNLASMQENLGKLSEASDNLDRALRGYLQHLRGDDVRIASVLNRQAILLFRQKKYEAAEQKFEDALRHERASVNTQPKTLAATLDDFSTNEVQLGKLDRADALAQEALIVRRQIFPDDHPTIARTLSNLSYIAWLKRKNDKALALAREASAITNATNSVDDSGKLRLQRHLLILWSKMVEASSKESRALAAEAFVVGQQAIKSDTASTLARTSLRFAEREPRLNNLLRGIDDLDRRVTSLEQNITHSATLASNDASDKFGRVRAEMSALAARRKATMLDIERLFPEYSRLVDPKPMTASHIQSLLRPTESLIMFVVGFQDVFVWCVTKEGFIFQRLEVSPERLEKSVKALRLSLDRDPEGELRNPLFDLKIANALYSQLIEPFAAKLKSKSKLIVVPSGPLVGLPLHLLVASRPKGPTSVQSRAEDYKTADWLVKSYAISIVPAVESLDRLRRRAIAATNRKPLIGFANPLPSPNFEVRVETGQPSPAGLATRGTKVGRGLPADIRSTDDIASLRAFLAKYLLPESEPELREVAGVVGAAEQDLYIGRRATETVLKTADLSSYRIIYFATHGQLANKFGESEPSLALTVPDRPNDFDDGLLTASEVSQLVLDADWVVLSACDTASGQTGDAEGLSGLARAFFHAGARAILVSNWTLDDISARQLMKATFLALENQRSLAKSQALRAAMIGQIDNAGRGERLWDAYPGRWATFEVVGDD